MNQRTVQKRKKKKKKKSKWHLAQNWKKCLSTRFADWMPERQKRPLAISLRVCVWFFFRKRKKARYKIPRHKIPEHFLINKKNCYLSFTEDLQKKAENDKRVPIIIIIIIKLGQVLNYWWFPFFSHRSQSLTCPCLNSITIPIMWLFL